MPICRGQLVHHRDPGGPQLAPGGVGPSPPVLERGQAGAANRHVALSVPPSAAEGVGDYDAGSHPGQLAQACPQGSRRGVRVMRQQHDRVLAGDVGGVHAGVCAHEAVMRYADQDATGGTQDLT